MFWAQTPFLICLSSFQSNYPKRGYISKLCTDLQMSEPHLYRSMFHKRTADWIAGQKTSKTGTCAWAYASGLFIMNSTPFATFINWLYSFVLVGPSIYTAQILFGGVTFISQGVSCPCVLFLCDDSQKSRERETWKVRQLNLRYTTN